MRLERASAKAVRYAIMNWHYSRSVPNVGLAYSVFNQNREFCGVICFGVGAVLNIGKPYGLRQGQVIELLRVALNGKHGATTKAVALALKLVKKDSPNVKLVVSYADSEQGHLGVIYQASNWFYTGFSIDTNIIVNGKREHRRTLTSRYGTNSVEKLKKAGVDVGPVVKTLPKHKYIYPLDKSLIPMCKAMSKPYPKPATVVQGSTPGNQPGDDGRPDPVAQNK